MDFLKNKKFEFEIGIVYDAAVNGQIWSFKYDGTDPDDDKILWITWMTGEEEISTIEELLPLIEELNMLKAAGIIYPRGNTEEAQVNALIDLMAKPTYYFAKMLVPRSLVLTYHFAPDELVSDLYERRSDFMEFSYDTDSKFLTVTTPKGVDFPEWIRNKFDITGIMHLNEGNSSIWKIDISFNSGTKDHETAN